MKRLNILAFAIGAVLLTGTLLRLQARSIEQSTASADMSSPIDVREMVGARPLPTEDVEDMSLIFAKH
jgi:hypothetical protein